MTAVLPSRLAPGKELAREATLEADTVFRKGTSRRLRLMDVGGLEPLGYNSAAHDL
jgi:hypothetical protein